MKNAQDDDAERWEKLVNALAKSCGWDQELGEFNVGEGPEGDAEKLRELMEMIHDMIHERPSFVEIK
jgi:hypothetical protein